MRRVFADSLRVCWQAVACSLVWLMVLCPAAGDELSLPFVEKTLTQKCFHCHSAADEVNGELDLAKSFETGAFSKDAEVLQAVLDVIQSGEMPPDDEPLLDAVDRERLEASLRSELKRTLSAVEQPNSAPIRRMNRFQYNNAVTDLFQLNCIVFTLPERMMREHKGYFQPASGKMATTVTVGCRPLGKSQLIEPRLAGVAPFPQDLRAEHGFDNQGDHLSLSPLLMEAFLKLGRSITQSRNFDPKSVGIWNEMFEAPSQTGATASSDGVENSLRDRLDMLLTLAFRGPPPAEQLARYVAFAEAKLASGASFSETMKAVAAAVIASPKFLYLYEQSPESSTDSPALHPLDDLELASRLSFFLWGSIPDQELIDLAVQGELSTKTVLLGQVERMLRDKKVKRFCDSFPSQWLQLERIISSAPNREQFPGFYFAKYRDSMHMLIEPLLLFETVLIENLPITQFIHSDFTYRSTLLREAYGEQVPASERNKGGGVTVLTFDRLPVEDLRHGGVITTAATMTMTSGPERTQPITRGAWMATVVFNDPPDPPPADVPPLPEKTTVEDENLTLRERLVLHRQRADCRGCHEQIDPLGFALENYNPIGVWRDQYDNGREIDPAGMLFRKHRFANVADFKLAILSESDRFATGLAEHLLSFALARRLTPSDTLAVEKIVQAAAADDYRFQTLIKAIVLSDPFQHKSFASR